MAKGGEKIMIKSRQVYSSIIGYTLVGRDVVMFAVIIPRYLGKHADKVVGGSAYCNGSQKYGTY